MTSKQKRELTNLEMEAINLVNEDPYAPDITDEERYQELLETRQNRMAGENLFDFLQRKVKDQMGEAMGQPLQAVSETVLKGVSSKSLKSGLKRYNAERCKGYNVVRKRKGVLSPSRLPNDEELMDYSELSNEA